MWPHGIVASGVGVDLWLYLLWLYDLLTVVASGVGVDLRLYLLRLYLLRLYLLQVPIAIIGGNCAEQNAFIADLYEKEHDQSLAKVLGLP